MTSGLRTAGLFLLISSFSASAQSIDGIWQSQGYGYVLKIRGPVLTAFEVTATTCVLGFTAQRQSATSSGGEAAFKAKDKTKYLLKSGSNENDKLLHGGDAISDIQIERISKLPTVCDQLITNTPSNNFEVLTRTWTENYISFDLRHTD